jgi:hypothetical protein
MSPVIDFSRAFTLAWERMLVILFRPFDIGKWLILGFSAFLAGLLQGGNGYNGSIQWPNTNGNFTPNSSLQYHSNLGSIPTQTINAWTSLITGASVFFIALIVIVAFAVVILMYWLGARGQFLLLDNIVRNRAAIAWPWRAYARPGNNLFVFILLWLLLIFALLVPLGIAMFFLALPFFRQSRWPEGAEWMPLILIGLIYLVVMILLSVLFFLFRELGVPLMFRNGITARAALGETWRLLLRHPGSLAILVLLRIALFIGLALVQLIVCCVCCLELLPYVGTVLLLPAIIYIRCFTLDCLAQFGPEYDVWTVDLPPGAPPVPAPAVSPPPPPG